MTSDPQPLDCTALTDAPVAGWLCSFVDDFQHRFINLLAFQFRAFSTRLAMRLLSRKLVEGVAGEKKCVWRWELRNRGDLSKPLTVPEIRFLLTNDDLSRLASYSHNLVDYHMIMDLIPALSRLYFKRRFGEMSLSSLQEAILIGEGLQHKTVDELVGEFEKIDSTQLLALFNRSIRKMQKVLEEVLNKEEEEENRATKKFEEMMVDKMKPVGETLDQDLKKGEKAVVEKMKSQNVLDGVDLSEYKIEGSEKDWEKALKKGTKGLVSMPSTKKREKVEMKFEDPDEKKLKKAKKMHKRH